MIEILFVATLSFFVGGYIGANQILDKYLIENSMTAQKFFYSRIPEKSSDNVTFYFTSRTEQPDCVDHRWIQIKVIDARPNFTDQCPTDIKDLFKLYKQGDQAVRDKLARSYKRKGLYFETNIPWQMNIPSVYKESKLLKHLLDGFQIYAWPKTSREFEAYLRLKYKAKYLFCPIGVFQVQERNLDSEMLELNWSL